MARWMICVYACLTACVTCNGQEVYQEPYRPQIHFSPEANWMNDPNGLIYFQGIYHLFFQYYPDSTVWGPMHWGHAISHDLVHWKQIAIALYPDSLGYIFSGSAVADYMNSSGFGQDGKIPLVAIYTQHDPAGEKAGTNLFQNQSIAFSLDAGHNWKKYAGNPVLRTPHLKDFRDPKVIWYPEQKKWIMALAAGDRILFYSSKNLKSWYKESEFGAGVGAHGGVWECPDLIAFTVDGKKIWLLIVNINPGGVQGGSGTQYFTGDFDGQHFVPGDTLTRWADYGPDDYAGVTYSNTGDEKIFLGWMSNWQYGTRVPTVSWRSAMTIPRLINLKKIGQSYYTTMEPVKALESLVEKSNYYVNPSVEKKYAVSGPSRIDITSNDLHSFSFIFSNVAGQHLDVGYDQDKNAFFIDRSQAGKSDFDQQFAKNYFGPRISRSKDCRITMVLDNASLELFADQGLTTMTEIFFPDQPFSEFQLKMNTKEFGGIRISKLSSIWTGDK
jgi:fructan beta-fructosidase